MYRLSLIVPLALALAACKPKEEAPAAPAAQQSAPEAAATAPTAGAAAPASAAPAGTPFDLDTVPVSTASLPPFPYVGLPSEVKTIAADELKEFDRTHVLAGKQLRQVEGKISHRSFSLSLIGMSPLGAHRNYETALKQLGATRVDTVSPRDPAFVEANGGDLSAIAQKKLGLIGPPSESTEADIPNFEQYLLRTPTANIWISFYIFDNDNNVGVRVVEEKALQQTVSLIPAAQLASALQKDGHVALYLNFDTDSDLIRPDSLAAVDEIAKLLASDPQLKLKVEGHTDSDGDAAHNRRLSLARAQAVVKAVNAKGIGAERLSPEGLGPDRPLADNKTEQGKARNRRVELVRA